MTGLTDGTRSEGGKNVGLIDEFEDAWTPSEPNLKPRAAEGDWWVLRLPEPDRSDLLRMIAAEDQAWGDLGAILDELTEHLAHWPVLWNAGDGRGAVVLTMLRDRLLAAGVYQPPQKTTVRSRRNLKSGVRYQIMERDDFTCRHCGARKRLEIDHIHPLSKGGTDELDNLQTLCHDCNATKAARV